MNETIEETSPLTWTRTFVAFSSLAAGFLYLAFHGGTPNLSLDAGELTAWGFFAAVLSAPFVLRLRSMAAQVFGRAVLLQAALFCLLALVNSVFVRESSPELILEISAAWAAMVWPLAVVGRRGLAFQSRTFSPNAYRLTLTASLVMGLADTWALVFYSAVLSEAGLMLVCAAVMAVALFGLFRMKVWGLALCIAANLVIAALALDSAFDLPAVLSWGLVSTATLQLLLPVPLILTIVRNARGRSSE